MQVQGLLLAWLWLTGAPVAPPATGEIHVPFSKLPAAEWMVLVDVSLNGAKPMPAIIDTGAAVGVVSPEVAKSVGLKDGKTVDVNDGGGKAVKATIALVESVQLGAAKLEKVPFIEIPLPDGVPAQAVVGVQLFQKYVVRIDQTRRELVLTPHDGFKPDPKAVKLPLSFHRGNRSVVEAKVDGVQGRFLLDTGNNSGLILNAGFAQANDLVAKHKLMDRGAGGRTVVGKRDSWVGRVDSLEVGGYGINRPVVSVLKDAANAETDLAGNIGMEVWRQFDVTFDFQNAVLYLVPNRNYGKAVPYERVGCNYELEGGVYKVVEVMKGGPAEAAGVRVGDEVVTIAGRPVKQLDGMVRRMLFRGAVGSTLELGLKRDGKTLTVKVTLRDLL